MSERYYTMIGETVMKTTMEERVRQYHNRGPTTCSLDDAVFTASELKFDTIVTVVE